MSWSSSFHDYPYGMAREVRPSNFNVNEQCFIRKDHRCGKMLGASKSCFIACPTADDIEPILGLMSEKLAKVGVEPIIAVKERAYGQDIFCTKICGKIIESKFCIVILDDTVSGATSTPNPNVYYEYGLMTSLRKHIIPLQKEGLKLAFNIQSYDTIKYNGKNIASELDRAIKDAIKITEPKESEPEHTHYRDRTVLRRLELAGLQERDNKWFLWEVVEDTSFRGFGQYEKGFYSYLSKIDDAAEFQACLEDLDVVLYRTEKRAKSLENEISAAKKRAEKLQKEHKEAAFPGKTRLEYTNHLIDRQIAEAQSTITEKSGWLEMMKTIFVGFIIDPSINADAFKEKAKAIAAPYGRYHLSYSNDDTLKFGDLLVGLTPPTE